MKILVYDSGIVKSQEKIIQTIDIGQGIWDNASHGSIVCDIIKLLSPNTEIESIKILDDENSTTLDILMNALEYAIESNCEMVCLALSIDYNKDCIPLRKILEEINRNGKIIVCSNRNHYSESYPACYNSVIGCSIQDEKIEKSLYSSVRQIQSALPITAVWRKIEDDNFSILNRNSLNCAVMAGEISYITETSKIIERKAIEALLENMKWENYQFYQYTTNNKEVSYDEYCYTIEELTNIAKIYDFNLSQPLYMSNFLEIFLNDLFYKGYLTNIKNTILQPKDLYNIESLSRYICCKHHKNIQ